MASQDIVYVCCSESSLLSSWHLCVAPRWLQEDEDADEGDNEPGDVKPKGSTAKTKKQKAASKKQPKSKPNVQKAKAAGAQNKASQKPKMEKQDLGASKYVAGEYSQARLKWISKRRRLHGMSFREASDAWNTSRTREGYLANMSQAEKVRRRFV